MSIEALKTKKQQVKDYYEYHPDSQEINLMGYPTEKAGRYTISNKVMRRASGVRWSSYPVNLFERGRKLSSGKKEPGRRIISVKLKTLIEGNLQRWADAAEHRILNSEIDKA